MASSIQHPAAATDGKEQPVESPLYAAIDVGSNNLRLLVASLNEKGEPRVVDAFSRAIRLGAHLNDDGNIDPVALEKAANALRICAGKVRRAGVRRYRAVATEICRQAKNQRDFLDHIRQRTRLNVEIISCAEEARLAMMGVSPLVDEHITDCLVFDIGGASSEIVWGQKQDDGSLKLIDHISLPFGVITLGDRIDESEASRRASYDMLRTELQVAFMEAEQRWKLRDRVMAGKVQVIGASGTVTTLAGILLDLTKYSRSLVDGTDLKTADASAVIGKLLSQPPQLRAKHGCIGFNRCEMVLPGCAVFEAIIGIWPVDKVRVADRGVREGILLDLSRQYG